MVSDGDKAAAAESNVDGERLGHAGREAEAPDVKPEVASQAAGPDAGPEAEAPGVMSPDAGPVMVGDLGSAPVSRARPRRAIVGLGVVAVVMMIAVAVVGVLFTRERSAHDDARRALRSEAARAVQLERDLAAVRAERVELEKKLAAAEAQVLSPEAKAAIANCVKVYAVIERVMEGAEQGGTGSGSVEFVVPFALPQNESVEKVCTAAEPYLAKIS